MSYTTYSYSTLFIIRLYNIMVRAAGAAPRRLNHMNMTHITTKITSLLACYATTR
jgi:hypothetical protein